MEIPRALGQPPAKTDEFIGFPCGSPRTPGGLLIEAVVFGFLGPRPPALWRAAPRGERPGCESLGEPPLKVFYLWALRVQHRTILSTLIQF